MNLSVTQQAVGQSEALFAIQEFEAGARMFKIHRTPYWQLGQVVQEIHSLLNSNASYEAMYVAFLDDPQNVPPHRFRVEAGVLLPSDANTLAGFTSQRYERFLAATLTLPADRRLTLQDHERLRVWAKSKGHLVHGHIMEVYPRAESTSDRAQLRLFLYELPTVQADVEVDEPPQKILDAPPEFVGPVQREGPPVDEPDALIEFPTAQFPTAQLPPAVQNWVNDVAARLRVIAGIVEENDPAGHQRLVSLLSPLITIARGPQVIEPIQRDAALPALRWATELSDRDAVLKQIDRILVRAHLKVDDLDQTYESLVPVIANVHQLLASESGDNQPIGPMPVEVSPRLQRDRSQIDEIRADGE